MDRVPSDTDVLREAVTTPASPADARPSADNGTENGHAPAASDAGDDGSSLVTTPATRRKPRAKKSASTTAEKPKRVSRKKIEPPPPTPVTGVPSAPLTRADGTPAPVVHLVPELSPYARTGGLGEAVSSLARHQAASGIPVTVFMPLYGVVRSRTEVRPVGAAFAVSVGPRTETARIWEPVQERRSTEPRVLFVESEEYFDRP